MKVHIEYDDFGEYVEVFDDLLETVHYGRDGQRPSPGGKVIPFPEPVPCASSGNMVH